MRAIWQRAAAAHARVWGTVQMDQLTHSLLPVPDKKLSSNLLALNRAGIRVFIRMLTLHNGLNNHIYTGLADDLTISALGVGRVVRPLTSI